MPSFIPYTGLQAQLSLNTIKCDYKLKTVNITEASSLS